MAWFLGGFGVDRFYTGRRGLGALKLLTFGLCGMWSFADALLLLFQSYRDADGNCLKPAKGSHVAIGWSVMCVGVVASILLAVSTVSAVKSGFADMDAVTVTAENPQGGFASPQAVFERMKSAGEEDMAYYLPGERSRVAYDAFLMAGMLAEMMQPDAKQKKKAQDDLAALTAKYGLADKLELNTNLDKIDEVAAKAFTGVDIPAFMADVAAFNKSHDHGPVNIFASFFPPADEKESKGIKDEINGQKEVKPLSMKNLVINGDEARATSVYSDDSENPLVFTRTDEGWFLSYVKSNDEPVATPMDCSLKITFAAEADLKKASPASLLAGVNYERNAPTTLARMDMTLQCMLEFTISDHQDFSQMIESIKQTPGVEDVELSAEMEIVAQLAEKLRNEVLDAGKTIQSAMELGAFPVFGTNSSQGGQTPVTEAALGTNSAEPPLSMALEFENAHIIAQRNSCIANLKQIDGAKQVWALENRKPHTAIPAVSDIMPHLINRKMPVCPTGGEYTLNSLSSDPTCSRGETEGHRLDETGLAPVPQQRSATPAAPKNPAAPTPTPAPKMKASLPAPAQATYLQPVVLDPNDVSWRVEDAKFDLHDGPSRWSVSNGIVRQASNIYRGSPSLAYQRPREGTMRFYRGGKLPVDGRIQLEIRSQDDDAIGIAFRALDATHHYLFVMDEQRKFHALSLRDGSQYRVLAKNDKGYKVGEWHNIRIELQGATLTVYVDDTKDLEIDDATLDRGTMALYCWGSQGVEFRNITVAPAKGASFSENLNDEDFDPSALGSSLKIASVKASSQISKPYNGRPATAERLLEDDDLMTFWNSAEKVMEATWTLNLKEESILERVLIRWKSKDGPVGARAMRYQIQASTDGKSWATVHDYVGDDGDKAEDRMKIKPTRARFVRVRMSQSSYGSVGGAAYFSACFIKLYGTEASR